MTEEEKLERQYEYIESQSLETLTAGSYEQWGDPIKNREKLIPYGYKPIDRAIYGIDPQGEFIVIQGKEKGRKSTIMQNVVKNIMEWERLKIKPVIVIDILESSSSPTIVKDNFISMVASNFIMEKGHRSHAPCPLCGGKQCKELVLSSRALPFITRTPLQKVAIDHAIKVISGWSIYLFGTGVNEGETRDMDKTLRRWLWLSENRGASIFISDHVQQYHNANERTGLTDYEKQQIVVPALSTFVGKYRKTVIALSQLSLGTRKDNDGRMYATGGAKMAAEANTVIMTMYDENTPFQVALQLVESRYAGQTTCYGLIDPTSGVTHGEYGYEPPVPVERPMTEAELEESPFK